MQERVDLRFRPASVQPSIATTMISFRFGNTFAFDPNDSDDIRAQKASIFLVALACCVAGLFWSAMYLAVFGAGLIAAMPLLFSILVGSALIVSHISRDHRIAIHTQIACIVYITTVIQLRIGSVLDSGFVMAWAFIGPLIALMFLSVRAAITWQALFLVNVVVVVVFDDVFAADGQVVTSVERNFFFLMNLGVASLVVFAFAGHFVRNALNEKQKADRLLLSILPEKIARTLKSRDGVIAENFDGVSVLFADIVNYTQYSSDKQPAEVVSKLNEVFHAFDELTDRHGLEKIKTIGDAYMVVGGLPEPCEGHDRAIAKMALDMLDAVKMIQTEDGKPFSLRIGIHTGAVVAGVIGSKKFAYDLWGDTVNVASRLEANGVPGRVQVSEEVFQRLKDQFGFERRGPIEVKGKGTIEAHFLVS
ncbi:MAG: adenylate/guanylate cyclase domain-containing protein [Planctomycetota bacterium]|nr:adenylate/guanylate cyclase domain-containing protein [Planctomycetota bacterium]